VKYPSAPRSPLVETLHGVAVADPFRTLETADDPATVGWVDEQNRLTRRLLDSDAREPLVQRLRELHRVARVSAAAVRGERLFYLENDGTRAQAVLFMTRLNGRPATTEPVTLVDPNLLDADGTTAITVFEPDASGDRVVYGLSRHGSDMQDLLVHDVGGNALLDDRLQWVKFASIAWSGDAFFYTRYPQPGTVAPEHEQYFCQVWLHRLGTSQEADLLIYARPDAPEITFDINVTADVRHLVITSRRGASDDAEVHVVNLGTADVRDVAKTTKTRKHEETQPKAIVTGFSAGWHFIDGADDAIYFHTDQGAARGRVVRIDVDRPSPEPITIVPESNDTIVSAVVANGSLLVSSLANASSRLTTWSLDGKAVREIALPGLGTVAALAAGWDDPHAFALYTSFTSPPSIMTCDLAAGALRPLVSGNLPFDPADYMTEQVWYESRDGTRVSMFLTSKRTRTSDAAHGAVLLSGYGGFNISLTPSFDPSDFLWLDAGGTIAVANLRGGGEYGEAWHRAGMREHKQNVFDDFITAAEWLVASGRAASGRVAIEGGSNGGLLVAACMTQRPDLFGAVVCRVPVADMLRYHLFTVGRFWIPEYGCADGAEDFAFLFQYSPYHNVRDNAHYPPTLVMTADTDDRVAPGMAKKFAARLQEAVADEGGPILLRVETRAGHGAGKPIAKQVEEQADIYAFLFTYLTRRTASAHTRR
jgi:prolyl oligopeptidase